MGYSPILIHSVTPDKHLQRKETNSTHKENSTSKIRSSKEKKFIPSNSILINQISEIPTQPKKVEERKKSPEKLNSLDPDTAAKSIYLVSED
ncbi:hypothetical protein OnM2_030072 [Erysiphe neolycopersici]|uniref:Uncharacterized protein n=1 Tax=Erysiphe neolycopersici TaxID=212602 RepID=A0A420HZG2_9PEZI|nr:hypothetical protein OnM2_030072 [Erysiphe neolycopersici]